MNVKSSFTPQLESARYEEHVTYILGTDKKSSNRSIALSAPQKHQTPESKIDAAN
jgi:hypothetical protein